MRNSIEVPPYQHQTNIERPWGGVSLQPNFAGPLEERLGADIREIQDRQAKEHGFPTSGSIRFRRRIRFLIAPLEAIVSLKDHIKPLKWIHALRKAA